MMRWALKTGFLSASVLLLFPGQGSPSHEPFGIYEDWSSPTIRSDRWRGGEFGGTPLNVMGEPTMGVVTETRRETDAGTQRMRYRREGGTASNVGGAFTSNFLAVTHPLLVDQLEATFTVDDPVTVTACPENNTSRARPASLLLSRLNNGQGADIVDRTGDLFAAIGAHRDSSSMDPPGVLQVFGFLTRCDNANCGGDTPALSFVQLQSVTVATPFRLRVIWDAPNSQFLFGVDDNPNAALTYNPVVFFREARLPFANISIGHATANCVAGPAAVDSANRVGEFHTNTSAIIP